MDFGVAEVDTRAEMMQVAVLFDEYRQFYRQAPDLEGAAQYMLALLQNRSSRVFAARLPGEEYIGFAQVYPMWSSVAMQAHWVLNDLYVEPGYRKMGVGRAIILAVHDAARERGLDRVALKTEKSNTDALSLYNSLGYQPDEVFNHLAYWLK